MSIDGSGARVVATIVTHFAGDREPSVEDDLIYMRNEDGRWLILKPSATLYRAIGVGDIPPQVLAPPIDLARTGSNVPAGTELRVTVSPPFMVTTRSPAEPT